MSWQGKGSKSTRVVQKAGQNPQYVTDGEGRRRFHGAFTGGFSAGYFNTVGSKEGWTPQTFTSSRQSKGARVAQRPEDFMDEEDDPLLGKKLETKSQYDTLGLTAAEAARKAAADDRSQRTIPGPVPDELIVPSTLSIGKKLLQKMGWREGQGVGPRVALKSHAGEEMTVGAKNVVLEDWAQAPKTDVFGLGFDPYKDAPEFMERRMVLASRSAYSGGGKAERNVLRMGQVLASSASGRGGGARSFGLSALEDVEPEDLDVYDQEAIERYDIDISTGLTIEGPKRPLLMGPEPFQEEAVVTAESEDEPLEMRRCSDGRPPLRGFIMAKVLPARENKYREMEVPANFREKHHFLGPLVLPDYLVTRSNIGYSRTVSQIDAASRGMLLEGDGNNAAIREKQTTSLSDVPRPIKETLEKPPLITDIGAFAGLSSAMANRFTSAGTTTDEKMEDGANSGATVEKPKPPPVRTEMPWAPVRLLCKRFNVPPPAISTAKADSAGRPAESALFQKELLPYIAEAHRATLPATQSSIIERTPSLAPGMTAQGQQESEKPIQDTPRPPVDLFKAIFGADEEDQEEAIEQIAPAAFESAVPLASSVVRQEESLGRKFEQHDRLTTSPSRRERRRWDNPNRGDAQRRHDEKAASSWPTPPTSGTFALVEKLKASLMEEQKKEKKTKSSRQDAFSPSPERRSRRNNYVSSGTSRRDGDHVRDSTRSDRYSTSRQRDRSRERSYSRTERHHRGDRESYSSSSRRRRDKT